MLFSKTCAKSTCFRQSPPVEAKPPGSATTKTKPPPVPAAATKQKPIVTNVKNGDENAPWVRKTTNPQRPGISSSNHTGNGGGATVKVVPPKTADAKAAVKPNEFKKPVEPSVKSFGKMVLVGPKLVISRTSTGKVKFGTARTFDSNGCPNELASSYGFTIDPELLPGVILALKCHIALFEKDRHAETAKGGPPAKAAKPVKA